MKLCFLILANVVRVLTESSKEDILKLNLPPNHMPYFFTSHKAETDLCKNVHNCPYKDSLEQYKCWGYEKNCSLANRYSNPLCNGDSRGWTKSKDEQTELFFKQGDFGYIQERLKELTILCYPKNEDGGLLKCSDHMRFCKGKNILFDFKTLKGLSEPMRYRDDVIREGQVGAHCQLNKKLLNEQGQHKSPLQSWYAELEHFSELPDNLNDETCDITVNEPTFIMKLDATVNMYHHFCDFLNLYASLHMNQTFTTDIRILIWDTIPYASNFEVVWKAFTHHPLMNLGGYKGKKVCFKDVVFPLLPRMIFGMYYNMPLIPGCKGSGLFRAFSEHLKHSLKIRDQFQDSKVRVTLISRSTQYRQILNEDEIISSLEAFPDLFVRKVNFNRYMSFSEQMEISYNTDILIGIHGAGLTHMLFLPEWGAVFEIFNCEDENCYADLARLKGLEYFTWEKPDLLYPEDEGHHPTLGAHAKFTNYSFNIPEFLRIFKKAFDHVKKNLPLQSPQKMCTGSKCNGTVVHTEL